METYIYGSTLYGTVNEQSDVDYLYIVGDHNNDKKDVPDSMTRSNFIQSIKEHDIRSLCCIFSKEADPYIEYFNLDRAVLQLSFSRASHKAYAYAKILINKENDFYKAKKNIVHSMRILMFGIQILQYGKIVDFKCANSFYYDVMEQSWTDWTKYEKHYKPKIMEKSLEFRNLCSNKN